MLLFSQQISCIISVKNVVSSTGSSEQTCEYRLLGMINDRKEFQQTYAQQSSLQILQTILPAAMELVAMATMLTNDSYFMGNLYHLIIYSSKCAYNYEKGQSSGRSELCNSIDCSSSFHYNSTAESDFMSTNIRPAIHSLLTHLFQLYNLYRTQRILINMAQKKNSLHFDNGRCRMYRMPIASCF